VNRAKLSARLLYGPTGIFGRHRPLYFLNLRDRLRGRPRTLEEAARGKVVLITGASSGIGREASKKVAAAGATVLLVSRRAEELEKLRAEIATDGGKAEVHACDLSDTDEIERMAAVVLERHDHVDVLVNNAGRSIRRTVADSLDRFHDYERLMQLNYFGAVRLTLALLPTMRERGSGHVINVTTTGVEAKPPRFSAYLASKAALEMFADVAGAELGHEGIRFTNVQMGLVRTPMIEPTEAYRGMPSLSAEQAADWICDAIVHRPRRVGTPVSDVAGVFDALSPAVMAQVRSVGYRLSPDNEPQPLPPEPPPPSDFEAAEKQDKKGNASQ
jgi:NAD(P)-dependent dehydrogenase (short-subunit alcohol dehydrogenase family)